MENRITSEKITFLKENEIVVLGTNEAGKHGVGAAKLAYDMWGALPGQGFGRMGSCFGIPTKDWNIKTLPLNEINHYIQRFISYAEKHPELNFLVTKIGCGFAGYKPQDIAPMFSNCINLQNIYLPKEFIEIILGDTEALLENTFVAINKIPELDKEEIKEKYEIKEGICPPKTGECPMLFITIEENQKIYCPACNTYRGKEYTNY